MCRECVVILAYNEAERIGDTVDAFSPYAEVLVIADGDDGTGDIATAHGALVFSATQKRGYGAALKHGLLAAYGAGYDYATVVDVGTCDPIYLDITCKHKAHDIIVRARDFSGLHKRRLLSGAAAFALSAVLWRKIPDATFGYRTYNLHTTVPLLSSLRSNGHATNLELLGIAIRSGRTVTFTPVSYTIDAGQLKAKDLWEAFKCVIRLLFVW